MDILRCQKKKIQFALLKKEKKKGKQAKLTQNELHINWNIYI